MILVQDVDHDAEASFKMGEPLNAEQLKEILKNNEFSYMTDGALASITLMELGGQAIDVEDFYMLSTTSKITSLIFIRQTDDGLLVGTQMEKPER